MDRPTQLIFQVCQSQRKRRVYDFVTRRCWYRAAKCKAVSPLSVLAPSKAPESNKILTVDRWPFMAAQCRAVW
jgi:hypothetical protein